MHRTWSRARRYYITGQLHHLSMPRARAELSPISIGTSDDFCDADRCYLPQRVDAYWHCCLLWASVIDKPRTTAEMSEMACGAVDPEEIESEAVFYTQGNDADESANRDPRQRDSLGVSRQMMIEEAMRTPMTLPAERFNLSHRSIPRATRAC